MAVQNDINYKMRSILIDWLVEVHFKFKLIPSTLWLCVNLLDRYLTKVVIKRAKLQLIGVTALFISCKFEEIFPPEVRDCVYITDFAYEREEVLRTETHMLGELNYEIFVPTGYHFMTRYLNSIRASERTRLMASYYAERNLQESDMLSVKPHVYAAAAVYAALKQQNTQFPDQLKKASCWSVRLQEESGLKEVSSSFSRLVPFLFIKSSAMLRNLVRGGRLRQDNDSSRGRRTGDYFEEKTGCVQEEVLEREVPEHC
jgi:hypothetical protein